MTKSRRGRPRQPGERFPCGKLKGEADPEPRAVAAFKRARVLAEAQIIDPRWGSSVAQLVFFKRLSDREAAAAERSYGVRVLKPGEILEPSPVSSAS